MNKKHCFKCLSVFIVLLMLISMVPIVSVMAESTQENDTTGFAGGSGTEVDPYLIETKEQLNNVRNFLDSHFKLVKDIEFSDADFEQDGLFYNSARGWNPIGNDETPFNGIFDGNGYIIKNLYIKNVGGEFVGLFGYNNGTIKNLSLIDADVNARGQVGGFIHDTSVYVGIIAGYSNGKIVNCCSVGGVFAEAENAGSVSTSHFYAYIHVGGITGYVGNLGTVENCYNNSFVSSYNPFQPFPYTGGIAGRVSGIIKNCYNTGDISSALVGGIVGDLYYTGNVINCYYLEDTLKGNSSETDTSTKCSLTSMTNQDTYIGFDFTNIWTFDNSFGYRFPIIRGGYVPVINNTYDFAGGSGTEISPYLISKTDHLNNVRKFLDAHYRLISNVVFSETDFAEDGVFYNNGAGWEPIGSKASAFCGVFDGNGFTIENVTNNLIYNNENVSGSNKVYSTYVGLFGYNKGTLCNLTVSNAQIDVQLNSIKNNTVDGYIGIICGENEGTITNCSVSGKVRSTENYIAEQTVYTDVCSDVGGICGINIGTIQKCNSIALVIGYDAGGIAGGTNYGVSTIESCYNLGLVKATRSAGGICGGNDGKIIKCYNSGVVDGDYQAAGIAAHNWGIIENCFNSGDLIGSFVGGIDGGYNTGVISYCYNVGNINSTDYFGGITPPLENSASGTVLNSYYLDNIPEEVGSGRKEGTRYSYERMQNKDSYLNFDFSYIWEFDENADYIFPTLRNVEYKSLESIEVVSLPDKTEYLLGEAFDNQGMVVIAKYSNAPSEIITDYTCDDTVGMELGKMPFIIEYGGVSTFIEITVKEKPIKSISISQMPYKTVYMQGEAFDSDGIVIQVIYTDGTTSQTSKCTVIDTNTLEEGPKNVTVIYNGKYLTFEIVVIARALDRIEITKTPDKLNYDLGEKLDLTGIIVTAFYENGDVGTTTDYVVDYDKNATGIVDVTVSFMDKTTTFTICVDDPNTSEPTTRPTEPSTGDDTKPSDTTEPSTGDDTKPSEPVVDKGILGDVNGDGKVNIKDATMIQKATAKILSLTDDENIRANVNGDEKVNVKDATAIQKFVAKIETGFPIGESIV